MNNETVIAAGKMKKYPASVSLLKPKRKEPKSLRIIDETCPSSILPPNATSTRTIVGISHACVYIIHIHEGQQSYIVD